MAERRLRQKMPRPGGPHKGSSAAGVHGNMPRSKVRIAGHNKGSVGKGEPFLWPQYCREFLEKMGWLYYEDGEVPSTMSGPGDAWNIIPALTTSDPVQEGPLMADAHSIAPVELRDAVGFPGYRVGSDGSVWNATRRLLPFKCGRGYLAVKLRRDGWGQNIYVHLLVAEAFIGPRPPDLDVCHNDNNPTNNVPTNLRFDTRSGNLADRDRHGTHQRGERNPGARLTNKEAEEIRALRATGQPLKVIAARFKVQESTVSRIANGKRRKEVRGG